MSLIQRSTGFYLILTGAVMQVAFLGMVGVGDLRAGLGAFWGWFWLAAAAYAVAAWLVLRQSGGRARVRGVLGAALLFRLTLVFLPPTLSDDLFRYVWEGAVQWHGLNPYAVAPADPVTAPYRGAVWAAVNHPEVPTIYPPVAQLVFAGLAGLGAGVTGFKLAFVACDLGLCALLGALLRRWGRDPARVLLYAWHPLAVVEIAGSGHMDVLALTLLFLGIWAWAAGRDRTAVAALGGAVLAKWLPALLVPAFPTRRRWKVFGWLLAAPLLFLPYAGAGRRLFTGLFTYAVHWEYNAFGFYLLDRALAWLNPTPALKAGIAGLNRLLGGGEAVSALYYVTDHRTLAKGLTVLLFLGLAGWCWRRRLGPFRTGHVLFGALVLLAPTVHPWYLLWVCVFLPFFPTPAWIILSCGTILGYGLLAADGVATAVRWWVYGPFLAALLAQAVLPRIPGLRTWQHTPRASSPPGAS